MTDYQYNTSITMTNTRTAEPAVSSSSSDYDNYNIHTLPGVSRETRPIWTEEQTEAIKTSYCDNISDHITAATASIIEKAYQSGLTVDEIIMAIEETGLAPNPTPWYLKKILENWVENGVTVSKIRHLVKSNKGVAWWK